MLMYMTANISYYSFKEKIKLIDKEF